MSRIFTETEVLAAVADLTRPRLLAWVEARLIQPVAAEDGFRYREVDLARLQTLVDLVEGFELPGESLVMVMGLIDQLHVLRAEMEALMAAVSAEPEEVRLRLRAVIRDL